MSAWKAKRSEGKRVNLQPVDCLVVVELEDEFVYHAVDADSAADELERRALRIAEDEVVGIEVGEFLAADTARDLWGFLSRQ